MYINLSYQLYFLFQGNICIIMVIDETSVFTVISFRLYKIVNTCKKIYGWGWLSISYLLWGVILCSVLVGSFFLSNFADNLVARSYLRRDVILCSVLVFPILQIIMLDELEDELLMLDEVSRKENFTLDNLTLLEENDTHTGIQVICRSWIENVPTSRSIFIF